MCICEVLWLSLVLLGAGLGMQELEGTERSGLTSAVGAVLGSLAPFTGTFRRGGM